MPRPGRAAAGRRCGPSRLALLRPPLGGRGRRRRNLVRWRADGGDDADAPLMAEHPPGRRRGTGLGRDAAHPALDHARVGPAAAALGGRGDDLDQDRPVHAATPARGKTRRGRAGADGRSAPRGGRAGCPDRSRSRGWPRASAAGRAGSPPARRRRPRPPSARDEGPPARPPARPPAGDRWPGWPSHPHHGGGAWARRGGGPGGSRRAGVAGTAAAPGSCAPARAGRRPARPPRAAGRTRRRRDRPGTACPAAAAAGARAPAAPRRCRGGRRPTYVDGPRWSSK